MTLHLLIAAWLATFTGQTPTVCDPGAHYMLVVDAHVPAGTDWEGEPIPAHCTRVPVVTVCGAPDQLAWLIESEARAIDCGSEAAGEVRSVPIATAYPDSIVGYVARTEQVYDDWTVPAVAPHWGICQGPGCYCAGEPAQCEHIPLGGPNLYYCTRLKRLNPEIKCP